MKEKNENHRNLIEVKGVSKEYRIYKKTIDRIKDNILKEKILYNQKGCRKCHI